MFVIVRCVRQGAQQCMSSRRCSATLSHRCRCSGQARARQMPTRCIVRRPPAGRSSDMCTVFLVTLIRRARLPADGALGGHPLPVGLIGLDGERGRFGPRRHLLASSSIDIARWRSDSSSVRDVAALHRRDARAGPASDAGSGRELLDSGACAQPASLRDMLEHRA